MKNYTVKDNKKAIERDNIICEQCIHEEVCNIRDCHDADDERALVQCSTFKNKADFVKVVRCGQCQFAEELEKHCEINRGAYKHCSLWRGDETRNVWHKYKKYYRDYSIVEEDGFCSEGRRKEE